MKIGFIPMGPIGEYVKEDPIAAIDWVSKLGFDGIEGAAGLAEALGEPVPAVRTRFEAAGLACPVQGAISFHSSDDDIRAAAVTAAEIGAGFVADYYAPFTDRAEILSYCEYFMRAGRICREEGVGFLYHNHDQEMRLHDGRRGIDILLENTDEDLVQVELDVAWATFGGQDPVAIIEASPKRFPVLHIKDLAELHPGSPAAAGVRSEAVFSEVGTGVVNTQGVIDAARSAGVSWVIIEQDRMNALGPAESLETSYTNLRRMVG